MTVGSLPDMLTFTHDGRKLLVANEATPNAVADTPYTPALDPPGSVSIIDVARRTVVATAGFDGVPIVGDNVRLPASTRHGLRARVHRRRPLRRAGVRHDPGSQRDRRARPPARRVHARDRPRRQRLQRRRQRDRSEGQRRRSSTSSRSPRKASTCRMPSRRTAGSASRCSSWRTKATSAKTTSTARRPARLRRRGAARSAARLEPRLVGGQPVRGGRAVVLDSRPERRADLRQRQPPRPRSAPRAASTTTAAAATRASSPRASRCSISAGRPTRSSASSARRRAPWPCSTSPTRGASVSST